MQDNERAGAPCLRTPAARPAPTKRLNPASIPQTGADGQGPNRETRREGQVRDRDDDGLELTTLAPVRPRAGVLETVYGSDGRAHRRIVLSMPAAERARDRALEAGRAVSLDLVVVRPASGEAQRAEALAEVTAVVA